MNIKKVQLKNIESEWRKLMRNNTHQSPFCDYDFAVKLSKAYNSVTAWRTFPVFYSIFDSCNNVIMIVPLEIHFGKEGVVFNSFGSFFRIVYEDFIYEDSIPSEIMEECLELLGNKLGGERIRLYFQSTNTLLYNTLKNKYSLMNHEIMCKTEMPSNFEEFYNSMSKSTRNTIHYAKNRLINDGKSYKFYFYEGNELNIGDYKKFINVYINSYFSRYHKNTNIISTYIYKNFLKYKHPYSTTMNNLPSSICAYCEIDNQIAAVIGGYIQKNGDYVVFHRFGFEQKFSRYSPGILLLNDFIKYLIDMKKTKILDFSKGRETYKYKFLAKDFYQYGFKLVKKETYEEQNNICKL